MDENKETPQEVGTHEVCFDENGVLEMKYSSLVITSVNSGNNKTMTSILVDGKEMASRTNGISFEHTPDGDVRVSLKRTLKLTQRN